MTLINPQKMHMNSMTIAGITERTKNEDEFNPNTARLPRLWDRFFSENLSREILQGNSHPLVYGVYSSYESDASGLYTVTAGVEVPHDFLSTQFSTVIVTKGDYLVFTNRGAMPKAIIEAWQAVWQYFDKNTDQKRTYKTDFEGYISSEECAVYIGITTSS